MIRYWQYAMYAQRTTNVSISAASAYHWRVAIRARSGAARQTGCVHPGIERTEPRQQEQKEPGEERECPRDVERQQAEWVEPPRPGEVGDRDEHQGAEGDAQAGRPRGEIRRPGLARVHQHAQPGEQQPGNADRERKPRHLHGRAPRSAPRIESSRSMLSAT